MATGSPCRCTEDYVQQLVTGFEAEGVLLIERWEDENGTHHDMYQIVEAVVRNRQRPSQNKDVERPSRYKEKRKANKGSFSRANQPGKTEKYGRWTMKNSATYHRTNQPLATGRSALTTRTLSRRPPGHSTVGAPGHSAVTTRTLNRQSTAEYPAKHRLLALIFKLGLNLSALILQLRLLAQYAASCAALPRSLVPAVVHEGELQTPQGAYGMRAKGVWVYKSPNNPIAEDAKRRQQQKQRQLQEQRAARAERPVAQLHLLQLPVPEL